MLLKGVAGAGTTAGVDCSALSCYLSKQSVKIVRDSKQPSLHQLSSLFLINLASAAAELLCRFPQLSPDAIDFICVSGLVHFPPTEGGPVNYWKRSSNQFFLGTLQQLTHYSALHDTAETLIKDNYLFQLEPSPSLRLLSDKELRTVGPTRGLERPLLLLSPLPFGFLIFCGIVAFLGVTYYLLWLAAGPSQWVAVVGTLAVGAGIHFLLRE